MYKKLICPLVIVALTAAYLGLWIYTEKWFSREIDYLYANGADNGVRFLGPKPVLENFPFVPEINYTKGIEAGNARILFETMTVRGYPIPGLALKTTFPSGLSLDGVADPKIWMLNFLEADIIVPASLPASFEYEDLLSWKNQKGNITVKHYSMSKDALSAKGKGFLSLDDNLQPVFSLVSRVSNYDAFIADQVQNGLIEPFAGAIGTTILNGLAQTDEKTGEKSALLTVSVQNRMLQVGPLQALELPRIVWDKRSSPAPHL